MRLQNAILLYRLIYAVTQQSNMPLQVKGEKAMYRRFAFLYLPVLLYSLTFVY